MFVNTTSYIRHAESFGMEYVAKLAAALISADNNTTTRQSVITVIKQLWSWRRLQWLGDSIAGVVAGRRRPIAGDNGTWGGIGEAVLV
jgi:hypothetical protein